MRLYCKISIPRCSNENGSSTWHPSVFRRCHGIMVPSLDPVPPHEWWEITASWELVLDPGIKGSCWWSPKSVITNHGNITFSINLFKAFESCHFLLQSLFLDLAIRWSYLLQESLVFGVEMDMRRFGIDSTYTFSYSRYVSIMHIRVKHRSQFLVQNQTTPWESMKSFGLDLPQKEIHLPNVHCKGQTCEFRGGYTSFPRWCFHFFKKYSSRFFGRLPLWLKFFRWVGSTTQLVSPQTSGRLAGRLGSINTTGESTGGSGGVFHQDDAGDQQKSMGVKHSEMFCFNKKGPDNRREGCTRLDS